MRKRIIVSVAVLLPVAAIVGLLVRLSNEIREEEVYYHVQGGRWIADLKEPEPWRRREAAEQLGKFGRQAHRKAVPALREALDDADESVRDAAADALRRINPDTNVEKSIQIPAGAL